MPSMHFHPTFAWSLVEDLINSKAISQDHARGYVLDKLNTGRSEGWITPRSQQEARWMFVFAKDIILPGEVDLSFSDGDPLIGNIDGMHWGRNILENVPSSSPSPEFDDTVDGSWAKIVAPYIVGNNISIQDIDSTIDWWSRLRRFEIYALQVVKKKSQWELIENTGIREAVANGRPEEILIWSSLTEDNKNNIIRLLKDDPLKEINHFRGTARQVSNAVDFARKSIVLSRHGCPTLARTNQRSISAIPKEPNDYEAIVSFYFRNVILPAPENAKEALRLRQNDRIIEWRGKIEDWSNRIANGKIDLRSIKQELDDASGYIEGAKGIKTKMSFLKPWLTFPMAAALEFAPEFPGKRATQLTLIALEGAKHIAGAIHASAAGSQPPSYGWLLVEPPAPVE